MAKFIIVPFGNFGHIAGRMEKPTKVADGNRKRVEANKSRWPRLFGTFHSPIHFSVSLSFFSGRGIFSFVSSKTGCKQGKEAELRPRQIVIIIINK